jgi:hypothetical protein
MGVRSSSPLLAMRVLVGEVEEEGWCCLVGSPEYAAWHL